MPVLSMQDTSWLEARHAMLANGSDGVRNSQPGSGGARSQDDAMVGYFFQRPQPELLQQQYLSKRWAVGDDSVIEQVRGMTSASELERGFQNFGINEVAPKKIWDDDKAAGEAKMYAAPGTNNPWAGRNEPWAGAGEHPLTNPISVHRRPGSFPGSGDPASFLSPRSSETGALGVNMAEYVLGGSPLGKDLDPRLHIKQRFVGPGGDAEAKAAADKNAKAPSPYEGENKAEVIEVKDNVQTNGIMQNGLEDVRVHGSRQSSPIEEAGVVQQVDVQKLSKASLLEVPQMLPQHSSLHLDAPHFEPVGINPFELDYPTQLMPSSMDSPNFNLDYNQQLVQRQQQQQQQQQQQIALLNPQYALAAQQQLGLTAFPSTPYVLNAQEPYAVGFPVTGPAVVPQYYGVQTPWGIYPAAGILQQQPGQQTPQPLTPQQQQQIIRGQSARPLTPSQQNDLGTPTGGVQAQGLSAPGTPAGYQILAPAYYDQNGQLVMGNGRGMGTPVRLISPAPILVNAGQQGASTGLNLTALPVLTAAGQVITNPTDSQQNPGALGEGYTPTSSLYTPATTSLFNPISSLNPQQGYNGSSTPGAIGSGLSSQRRESLGSLDYKPRQIPQLNQYYNTLGSTSPAGPMGLVQPGQSLTPPPPSLTGSTTNLALGGLGTGGRLYSAAPGAEAKCRNGSLVGSNGLFGPSIFNPRLFTKSASLSKEVTGRSRLLEDFRNNRIPNLQLKDLVNHVVEFSQDQHGSRFIQQKLERATPAEKAMVFNEILSSAYSLMTDVFGNYVIQKFFEFGTSEQKQTLAQRVRGHVLPLALQMYGCRVIQKALESIPADMQVEIVKELDGHVLKCVKDQNGNHVVQKCIEVVDPPNLQFIVEAFKGQIYTLSTHPYGCRVIQRILEHCNPEQTDPILEELHHQVERLVQDQYGNYVIQHVLEHGRPEDKSKIVAQMRGNVLVLSQHKFASNVVEKCVSHSSRTERALMIEEVCTMNDGPHSALFTMMKDQFANYVVQKMIDVAEMTQRKMLMQRIRPHVAALRKFTYGKHILAKLEKFYMKNNTDLGPIGMPPNGALP